jgi:hypothetical protein
VQELVPGPVSMQEALGSQPPTPLPQLSMALQKVPSPQ